MGLVGLEPSVTRLLVSPSTPPPGIGEPSISMYSAPGGGPPNVVVILTATSPEVGPGPSLTLPARLASKPPLNGSGGDAAVLDVAGPAEPAAEDALDSSSAGGVPARRAQPLPRGPPGSHTRSTTSSAVVVASAPPRRAACAGQPRVARTPTAASTASTHAAFNASSQPLLTSLPVPSVCTRASGQQAYASQWMLRHVRCPRRWRSMLVIVIARSRSNATAPRPSHTGR